jgi:hypothetical protein
VSAQLDEPLLWVADHALEDEVADLVRDAVEVLAQKPRWIALAELDVAEHREGVPVPCPRDDLEAPIGVAKVPCDTAAQIGFPDVEDAPDGAVNRRRPEGRVFRGDLVEVTALIGNRAVQDPAGVRRHPPVSEYGRLLRASTTYMRSSAGRARWCPVSSRHGW